MIKTWMVDIVVDGISEGYKVDAEDSYDAKLEALHMFYDDYDVIAHLSDVYACYER